MIEIHIFCIGNGSTFLINKFSDGVSSGTRLSAIRKRELTYRHKSVTFILYDRPSWPDDTQHFYAALMRRAGNDGPNRKTAIVYCRDHSPSSSDIQNIYINQDITEMKHRSPNNNIYLVNTNLREPRAEPKGDEIDATLVTSRYGADGVFSNIAECELPDLFPRDSVTPAPSPVPMGHWDRFVQLFARSSLTSHASVPHASVPHAPAPHAPISHPSWPFTFTPTRSGPYVHMTLQKKIFFMGNDILNARLSEKLQAIHNDPALRQKLAREQTLQYQLYSSREPVGSDDVVILILDDTSRLDPNQQRALRDCRTNKFFVLYSGQKISMPDAARHRTQVLINQIIENNGFLFNRFYYCLLTADDNLTTLRQTLATINVISDLPAGLLDSQYQALLTDLGVPL